MGGCRAYHVRTLGSVVPKAPGVEEAATGCCMSVVLELGNSHTASPTMGGHENASVREGGRRRRRSLRLGCHGLDTGKVRQAWWTETASQTRTWGTLTRGSL